MKDRYHPYPRPSDHRTTWRPLRNVRQHRRRANYHSAIVAQARSMDEGGDEGQGASKRAKTHQAHMIPGLDHRTFGFPRSIITKLKYCDYYELTSTTGALAYQQIRANSIFDPDLTGVGHQPMYRDKYAEIYDHYVVIGSKITATFNHTTSTGSVIVGIHCDDDNVNTAGLSTIMEQNNTVWNLLGNNGSGQDVSTMTATFEPLQAFGIDAKNDGSSSTAIGSNPNEEHLFQLFAANTVAGTSKITVAITVEYTVKFSELQSTAQN